MVMPLLAWLHVGWLVVTAGVIWLACRLEERDAGQGRQRDRGAS